MSADTVRVKFVTKVEEYALPVGEMVIPSVLNRKGLSDAINMALNLEPKVPFDFKIQDNFLRQTVGQAVKLYQISTENAIRIEYFPAFKPPIPEEEEKTEDWISQIRYRNGNICYSLYDGSVVIGDKTFKTENDEDGEPTPAKCFNFVGNDAVVIGAIDGTITVNSISGSFESNTKRGNESAINAIASHPAIQQMFFVGSADFSLGMLDLAQEVKLVPHTAQHTDSVTAIEWPEPEKVVSCSMDRTVRFWDIKSDMINTQTLTANCAITAMAVRGNLVLTAHTDRSVSLWDTRAETGHTVIGEFKGHSNWVSAVSWVNDEIFVTGGYDGAVKLWNRGTQIPLYTVSQQDEKVFSIAVDDKNVAFGGTGEVIRKYKFE